MFGSVYRLSTPQALQSCTFHHRRHCRQLPSLQCRSSSSSSPVNLTRLQREAQSLVALDVEYAHILVPSTGQRLQLVAELCIVNWQGEVLLHTLCNGLPLGLFDPWEFKGGVPVKEWLSAPHYSEIKPKVLEILGKSRPVVGHNLGKDLAALEVEDQVSLKRRRDTMRYAALQGPSGFGRSLAELADKKLGRKIQVDARHDPEEDAIAALDLYLKYCHYDPDLMDYDDLVEYYASQLLSSADEDA